MPDRPVELAFDAYFLDPVDRVGARRPERVVAELWGGNWCCVKRGSAGDER